MSAAATTATPASSATTSVATPGSSESASTIVNRHGDVEGKANLSVADWARRWTQGQAFWHRPSVQPALIKYAPNWKSEIAAKAIREGTAPASEAPTVLVPLCGKTVDLVWLYDQGYRVIGVEIVTQAVVDFFYENSEKFPAFRAEKLAGTNVYRYTSGAGDRLQILQADIFTLTRELIGVPGGVDAVWDRASLVAINPHQRVEFADMIQRLCAPTAQQLFNVFHYDQEAMDGPPFSVPPEVIAELYSDAKGFTRQLLDSSPLELDGNKSKSKTPAVSSNYLFQKKQ